MWPNTRSKTSIGTSRKGIDSKRWERIIEQEVTLSLKLVSRIVRHTDDIEGGYSGLCSVAASHGIAWSLAAAGVL